MTTAHLIDDLKRDEGLRLRAYPDPRSGAEPWTCGYGCTGDNIGPHTTWTEMEAQTALVARVHGVEIELDHAIPWWRRLSDVRQDVLANMAYNLGVKGLLAFETVLADARAGLYARAADAMLRSAWAGEVHARAGRLASQMRTGARPGDLAAAPPGATPGVPPGASP